MLLIPLLILVKNYARLWDSGFKPFCTGIIMPSEWSIASRTATEFGAISPYCSSSLPTLMHLPTSYRVGVVRSQVVSWRLCTGLGKEVSICTFEARSLAHGKAHRTLNIRGPSSNRHFGSPWRRRLSWRLQPGLLASSRSSVGRENLGCVPPVPPEHFNPSRGQSEQQVACHSLGGIRQKYE